MGMISRFGVLVTPFHFWRHSCFFNAFRHSNHLPKKVGSIVQQGRRPLFVPCSSLPPLTLLLSWSTAWTMNWAFGGELSQLLLLILELHPPPPLPLPLRHAFHPQYGALPRRLPHRLLIAFPRSSALPTRPPLPPLSILLYLPAPH